MTITSIELTDWCQHEHLKVNFSPKSTGIFGKNGCGKTNLTRAIRVALTGRTDKGSNLEDEIREGQLSTKIELNFVHQGTPGVISRRFYRASTNRASIEWGDSNADGITDTNAMIASMTQSSTDMIEKFSFVGQDSLRAVLFDTPSKRVEQLISMIPAIAYTRLYRGRVEEFLKTIPEISLPYDKDHVLGKLQEYSDLGDTLSVDFAKSAIDLFNIGDCEYDRGLLNEQELFLSVKNQAEEQSVNISNREAELTVLTSELHEVELVPLPVIPDGFDLAFVSGKILQYDEFDFGRYSTWESDKAASETLIDSTRVNLTSLRSHLEDSKTDLHVVIDKVSVKANDLAIAKHSYSRWEGINEDQALCPICGTDLSADEMRISKEKDLALVTQAENEFELVEVDLSAARTAVQSIEDLILADTASITNSELILTKADLYFASVVFPESSIEEIEAFRLLVKYYEDKESLSIKLETCRAKIQTKQSELDLLKSVTVENNFSEATEEQITNARSHLEEKSSLEHTRDKLLLQMESSNEEFLKFKDMLQEIEDAIDAKAGVDDYRDSVLMVRDLLHRDQLPKIVLQFYLDSLRKEFSEYLNAFGAPFTVRIDDDFNLFFVKDGGEERGINRFSGGEKTVSSISLHLSISEMFGHELGLLVLDEPTSNMDEEYLNQFARIVETLASGLLGGDRQLVVVTHQASSLKGVFDEIIELDDE